MSSALEPTYRVVPQTDPPLYQCLLCPHEATDADLFILHMGQRHAGWMLREPPAEEPETPPVPDEPTPAPEPAPDEEDETVPVAEAEEQ